MRSELRARLPCVSYFPPMQERILLPFPISENKSLGVRVSTLVRGMAPAYTALLESDARRNHGGEHSTKKRRVGLLALFALLPVGRASHPRGTRTCGAERRTV